jgi:hypothetical protein
MLPWPCTQTPASAASSPGWQPTNAFATALTAVSTAAEEAPELLVGCGLACGAAVSLEAAEDPAAGMHTLPTLESNCVRFCTLCA